jgi:hypothetical protein
MSSQTQLNPKRSPAATGFLVILAAAALAVSPQLIWGDSCGHDFDFHLVSWFDALNSWRHGIAYPHWTTSANFGAGEPRFVFYSPLTWMLGAALGAVLPWSVVPVALTFALLAGTGLATRVLAREALGEGAATLAGCLAIFSGYPLFTAYERSAFAELAGGIWIPLVLLYALRNRDQHSASGPWRRVFDGSVAPLALAIGGAWLSNPTVGVMACYSLAALAIASAWVLRSSWPALRAVAGAVLGIGISAIYLLPAAWEQRWVDIHKVTENPGQTLENNWLFSRHADPALAFHDQVLHTASMIVVVMIVLTLTAFIACKLRGRLPGPESWWIPLAIIPIAVLLLQFSYSAPFWNLLPDLRFLQFPWRWLLILEAPMAIFLAAAVWPRSSAKRARIAIVVLSSAVFVCLTAATSKYLYQACHAEDAVPSMFQALQAGSGYNGTFEYEPIGEDIEHIAMSLPQACLVNDPNLALGSNNADGDLVWDASQGSCEATFSAAQSSGPEHLRINGVAPNSGFLILRQLRYPAWQLKLNGKPIASRPVRLDGLMVVPIVQGSFALTVDWTATRDVVLARWFSGVSLFVLTAICLFERRGARRRKAEATSVII